MKAVPGEPLDHTHDVYEIRKLLPNLNCAFLLKTDGVAAIEEIVRGWSSMLIKLRGRWNDYHD